MGISILEAMARGGLEAYNEDIRKQRDYNMMADLELQKANIQKLVDGEQGRFFTVKDGNGNDRNLFKLNNPSDWDATELLDQDMNLIASTLTAPYMNNLKALDPTLAHNTEKMVGNYIQNSFVKRTTRTGENQEVENTPEASVFGNWYEHEYFSPMFREIYKNGVVPQELLNNENMIFTAKEENGVVVPNVQDVTNSNFGFMYNRNTQMMEPVDINNLSVWSSEMNKLKGVNYSAEQYTSRYTDNGIALHNTPVDQTMQANVRNAFPYADANAPITLGQIANKIVQQSVPDQDLSDSLYYTIATINKTRNETDKINLDTIYNMFKLAAPNILGKGANLISNSTPPKGEAFIKKYYPHINTEDLVTRRDASQNVIDTTTYLLNDIDAFEEDTGTSAPINRAVVGITQLIAGLFGGEDSVPDQAMGLVSKYQESYKVNTAKGVQKKIQEYSSALEDTGLTKAATLGAKHRFYKYMLAYQLAVAIQGGTGGRTVSDQDVDNMLNAIGDRLFANGRVQVNVLNTIRDFAMDINKKNQYWLRASSPAGGPDAAFAADAMDRYMYNLPQENIDVAAVRTKVAGERLAEHLNQEDLAPAESLVDENFMNSERSGGVYTPNASGFGMHINDFLDSGVKLTENQYYTVLDEYIYRNSDLKVLRNKNNYNYIVNKIELQGNQ